MSYAKWFGWNYYFLADHGSSKTKTYRNKGAKTKRRQASPPISDNKTNQTANNNRHPSKTKARKTDDGSASFLETMIPSAKPKQQKGFPLPAVIKKRQKPDKKSTEHEQSYLIDVFKTIIKDELKKHSSGLKKT
jgi:hypothetical protein